MKIWKKILCYHLSIISLLPIVSIASCSNKTQMYDVLNIIEINKIKPFANWKKSNQEQVKKEYLSKIKNDWKILVNDLLKTFNSLIQASAKNKNFDKFLLGIDQVNVNLQKQTISFVLNIEYSHEKTKDHTHHFKGKYSFIDVEIIPDFTLLKSKEGEIENNQIKKFDSLNLVFDPSKNWSISATINNILFNKKKKINSNLYEAIIDKDNRENITKIFENFDQDFNLDEKNKFLKNKKDSNENKDDVDSYYIKLNDIYLKDQTIPNHIK